MWSNSALCSESRTNLKQLCYQVSIQTTLRLISKLLSKKSWNMLTYMYHLARKHKEKSDNNTFCTHLLRPPSHTVRMSWNNRIRWAGAGWQGRNCFSMGSKKQREEKLNSQANVFGEQKSSTAAEGEARDWGCGLSPCLVAAFQGFCSHRDQEKLCFRSS